jgi:hypothetical protein
MEQQVQPLFQHGELPVWSTRTDEAELFVELIQFFLEIELPAGRQCFRGYCASNLTSNLWTNSFANYIRVISETGTESASSTAT